MYRMFLLFGLAAATCGSVQADDSRDTKAAMDSYRWQLTADATRLAEERLTPAFVSQEVLRLEHPDNEFRSSSQNLVDNNASGLGKLMRVRSLSLLTLASAGEARLFIGISDDGIPGIHLARLSKKQKSRHVELSRLPFLARSPE